jgi:hypothetical protein
MWQIGAVLPQGAPQNPGMQRIVQLEDRAKALIRNQKHVEAAYGLLRHHQSRSQAEPDGVAILRVKSRGPQESRLLDAEIREHQSEIWRASAPCPARPYVSQPSQIGLIEVRNGDDLKRFHRVSSPQGPSPQGLIADVGVGGPD